MAVPGDSKLENESDPLRQIRSFHGSCRIYISCSCRDSRAGACRAAAAGGVQGYAASFCEAFGAAGGATHDDPWQVETQP